MHQFEDDNEIGVGDLERPHRSRVKEMKVEDLLPKTTDSVGGIYRQRTRCGKGGCHCAKGELHEGLYYIRRVNGERRKTYLSKSAAAKLAPLLREIADFRHWSRASAKAAMHTYSEMRRKLRETNQ